MNDKNREIAEKVMGFISDGWSYPDGYMIDGVIFDPMHRIEHAWMALDKWKYYRIERWGKTYTCKILLQPKDIEAQANTKEGAICLAALAAKEGEL